MTLDNVVIYNYESGNWEEVDHGANCSCAYGYYTDGVN